MIPAEFTNVTHAPVIIGKHVIIGSGSIVLPGVSINDGAVIGALSFVKRDCDEFTLYAGNPLKRIKERQRNIERLELDFRGKFE